MSDIDEFDLSFLYLICVTFARVKINSQRILVVTDKNVQGAEGGGAGGAALQSIKKLFYSSKTGLLLGYKILLKLKLSAMLLREEFKQSYAV